ARVDGLFEVDNDILAFVGIVVAEARGRSRPRFSTRPCAAPVGPAWLRAACALRRGATDRRARQRRAGRIRQRRAPRSLRRQAARRGASHHLQHHSRSWGPPYTVLERGPPTTKANRPIA